MDNFFQSYEEEEQQYQDPTFEADVNHTGTSTGSDEAEDEEPLDAFCQDHIRIPPQLPDILKQFTKAAIRTQPRDMERWAAAYFRAMADGEVPPVKETLEYPSVESKDGLTVGLLRVLDKQVRPIKNVFLLTNKNKSIIITQTCV